MSSPELAWERPDWDKLQQQWMLPYLDTRWNWDHRSLQAAGIDWKWLVKWSKQSPQDHAKWATEYLRQAAIDMLIGTGIIY